MDGNNVMVIESNLAVRFTDKAITDLKEQKSQLVKFVNSQLRKDVDYGIIPGVKNPSLFKPGAEKLANLFQLGSRIVKTDRQVDIEKNFAMISHTVEVFHIPTGKVISQCEGITNSQEKKWRERKVYNTGKTEPTPIGDLLNTLGKMALKRAYVGAIIMAVGASDFFTQDVEDMPEFQQPQRNVHAASNNQPGPEDGDPNRSQGYIIPFGKFQKRSLEELPQDQLRNYVDWLDGNAVKTGKPLGAVQIEFIERASTYLASMENGPKEDDVP
jgi:hypothetical protein